MLCRLHGNRPAMLIEAAFILKTEDVNLAGSDGSVVSPFSNWSQTSPDQDSKLSKCVESDLKPVPL